jgi:hypothetical protein
MIDPRNAKGSFWEHSDQSATLAEHFFGGQKISEGHKTAFVPERCQMFCPSWKAKTSKEPIRYVNFCHFSWDSHRETNIFSQKEQNHPISLQSLSWKPTLRKRNRGISHTGEEGGRNLR